MSRKSIQRENSVSSAVASTSVARTQYLEQRNKQLAELKATLVEETDKILNLMKEQDVCKAKISALLQQYTIFSAKNEKAHAEALETNIEINRYMRKAENIQAQLRELEAIIENEKTTMDEYKVKFAEKIETWGMLLAKIEQDDAEIMKKQRYNELEFQKFCLQLKSERHQLTISIHRLEQENEKLQQQISGKLETQKELNDRKEEFRAINEAAAKENQEMITRLDELKNLNATKQHHVEQLQTKFEEIKAENNEAESISLQLEETVEEFTGALHTLTALPIDTLESMKIQLAEARKSIQKNKQLHVSLDLKQKKLVEDIDELQKQSDHIARFLEEERQKLTPDMFKTAETQLADIIKSIEAAEENAKAKELEIQYNNEIKNLEAEYTTLDERYKLQEITHANDLKKYSKQLADLTKECNLKKERIYEEMKQWSVENNLSSKHNKIRKVDNLTFATGMNQNQTSDNEEETRVQSNPQSSDVSSSQNSD